jgi:hypothetical protein
MHGTTIKKHTYIQTYLSHILKGRNYMEDLKADDDAIAWIRLFRTAQCAHSNEPSFYS